MTMNLPVTIQEEILRSGPNRIFVFSEARSGSNWLVETLNSHREIFLLKEIMQPGQREDFYRAGNNEGISRDRDVAYIEKQLSSGSKRLKGCKILFPQAIRFMDLYEFTLNYRYAYFILLSRRNCIRGEISGMIAREASRWHSEAGVTKHRMTVDPEFLYHRVLWRSQTARFCADVLKSHCPNILELRYEDLFTHTDHELGRILGFLNLNDREMTPSREVRLNTHSLHEIIINYEEVRDFFMDREPFSGMFD